MTRVVQVSATRTLITVRRYGYTNDQHNVPCILLIVHLPVAACHQHGYCSMTCIIYATFIDFILQLVQARLATGGTIDLGCETIFYYLFIIIIDYGILTIDIKPSSGLYDTDFKSH